MIKIQNYDKEKQKISFVTDIPISLANAIRRGGLEIPIMTIDEVDIIKNDSALYDEILAHRLGLVPIKTDKIIKETKFKLKETGPKTVYSKDITPSVGTDFNLPLVILGDGQKIELIANAKLGIGNDHVKYSPGLIYYKHNVDPEILNFINIDSEGKINYDESELKEKGISEEQLTKIKKLSDAKELVFEIESWGQIDAKKIFLEAIEILDKNLIKLNKTIK